MVEPDVSELAIMREYFGELTDRQLAYVIRHYTDWPNFTPSTTVMPDMRLRRRAEELLRDRGLWYDRVKADAQGETP